MSNDLPDIPDTPEGREAMRAVARQLAAETADLIALIQTVSKPGENLNGLQAIHRCLKGGDPDTAAEIAVLLAHQDPDACENEETMLAETYRLFDLAIETYGPV